MMNDSSHSSDYGSEVDIYSFGVTMWFVMCRREPYDLFYKSRIPHAVMNNQRPSMPVASDETPEKWINLIARCWDHDPHQRPRITEVKQELEAIHDILCEIELHTS